MLKNVGDDEGSEEEQTPHGSVSPKQPGGRNYRTTPGRLFVSLSLPNCEMELGRDCFMGFLRG